MNHCLRSLVLVLPLALASSAFAQHETFNVAADQSQVDFTLGASDHVTNGSFHVQSGTIQFDPSNPKMAGQIVVAAGSGKTGNDSRDKKMWKDVLDVPHFADITFVPQSFQGTLNPTGDSTLQVSGIFTLHGTPHNMTVPMQIHIEGSNLTAKTQFVVPYVQWGLKDPSWFVLKVAKEVNVTLTLNGKVS